MNAAFIDVHLHAMAEARRTHSLRTVAGHAYPLSEREFNRYETERRELRRKKAAAFLKHLGPRAIAEAAFA